MTKPITLIDDVVEIYFESGSARIRFKEFEIPESLPDEKLQNGNTSLGIRDSYAN